MVNAHNHDGNLLIIHTLFLICPTFSVENIRVLVRVLAKMGPALGPMRREMILGVILMRPVARDVAANYRLPALGNQTGFDAGAKPETAGT